MVVFATTPDGLRLPVIDLTHPAFAVADEPASLAARRDAFLAWVANLTTLARATVPIVAGSVTSSSEVGKRMIAQSRFRPFARGLEGFAPLAERSGYAIAESRTAVVSEQVLLRPRTTVPPL